MYFICFVFYFKNIYKFTITKLHHPHNNQMSYKYLHLIWTCIFPIIQSCTKILVNTLTQQFNRIFVPIVFCLSEFCVNISISIFTQYCPHSIFKNSSKLNLKCIHLNPCSFNRIPQIYIYIWGTNVFLKPNPTILFIFWIYFIIGLFMQGTYSEEALLLSSSTI